MPNYESVSEHLPSRVILLAKKKFKKIKNNKKGKSEEWHTWIDFDKFQKAYETYLKTGKEFSAEDYLRKTPEIGLSGRKTLNHLHSD